MAGLIFILVLIVGVAILWRLGGTHHGRASKRLVMLGFAFLVALTILNPELTTSLANYIGLGRGADLVFYLTSIGLMFLAAITYLSHRRTEDRVAELVSAQAVSEAVKQMSGRTDD